MRDLYQSQKHGQEQNQSFYGEDVSKMCAALENTLTESKHEQERLQNLSIERTRAISDHHQQGQCICRSTTCKDRATFSLFAYIGLGSKKQLEHAP